MLFDVMSPNTMIPPNQWDPKDPREIAPTMDQVSFPWGLGGGNAVEQFVGNAYRPHEDTDLVVFRKDQLELQKSLKDWVLYASDPPGHLRRWADGEYLEKGTHDVWGHRHGGDQWQLQVMIQEMGETEWLYRRDETIRGPLAEFFEIYGGLPCVRIEIQLLYKSGGSGGMRSKDEEDFMRCLPLLGDHRARRLCRYLDLAHPQGHTWLSRLNQHNQASEAKP